MKVRSNCYACILASSLFSEVYSSQPFKEKLKEYQDAQPVLFYTILGVVSVILLLFICTRIQYLHQRSFLKERLPMARDKLYKAILIQEQILENQEICRKQQELVLGKSRSKSPDKQKALKEFSIQDLD